MYVLNRVMGWYYAVAGVLRPRSTADRVVIGATDQSGTLSVDGASSVATAISTAGRISTQGITVADGGRAWIQIPETDTLPTTSQITAGCGVAMVMKHNQLVFAHNCGGSMRYLTISLDGLSCAWVQKATAP